MEVYNPTQYSFSELYLQILPEGRIRRRQYIGRMVGGGILLGIIFFALSFFLGNIIGNTIFQLLNGGFIIVAGIMWYALNTKRIRDIGKDPQMVQKVTIGLIGWNILYSLYVFMGESGWIAGYVGTFRRVMAGVLGTTVELPWHQLLMEYAGYAVGMVGLLLFLYLFLIPGKTGDNEFGKDPINTKLGFFG